MQKESKIHMNRHGNGSYPPFRAVIGFLLEDGDILEETDVYDSASGSWEPCPCPGLVISGTTEMTQWVRPGEL